MQYLGLLNAIPTSWKKLLKGIYGETEINDCEDKITDIQNILSKTLRQILTKKFFEKPASRGKLDKAGFSAEQTSQLL